MLLSIFQATIQHSLDMIASLVVLITMLSQESNVEKKFITSKHETARSPPERAMSVCLNVL